MTIVCIKVYPSAAEIAEGGFSALVTAYGVEFAAKYVAGEARTFGTGGERVSAWRRKSAATAARAWIEAEVKALGPAFARAHSDLYA